MGAEANKLQGWLQAKGMTQARLAKDMGVHESVVSRIITGERLPNAAFCWRFFRAFGSEEMCEALDVPPNGNGRCHE